MFCKDNLILHSVRILHTRSISILINNLTKHARTFRQFFLLNYNFVFSFLTKLVQELSLKQKISSLCRSNTHREFWQAGNFTHAFLYNVVWTVGSSIQHAHPSSYHLLYACNFPNKNWNTNFFWDRSKHIQ